MTKDRRTSFPAANGSSTDRPVWQISALVSSAAGFPVSVDVSDEQSGTLRVDPAWSVRNGYLAVSKLLSESLSIARRPRR
ncbi:hypothetical protein ACQJ2V_28550, partial [Klebsiella variicola subsp. variicola]|uniref:hypothetical protein n=1 Tax=Klebsiella variicola TaxID=244366 RepID=UPI003CFD1F4D